MEILDATEACFVVDEDLLDFTLDDEAEQDEHFKTIFKSVSASSPSSSLTTAAAFSHEKRSGSFHEFIEEELEWLSNKDAFPSVDTCFGILSDNPELIVNHQSPISVLENNSNSNGDGDGDGNGNGNRSNFTSCCGSLKVPVRPRSKRRGRKRRASFGALLDQQLWSNLVNVKNKHEPSVLLSTNRGGRMGRRCLHCHVDKTPQWRAGPMGPKTLCNACGVRYKSGRLVPEYRPANSPTFSSALHSNSHRKVVEMRRQKYLATTMGAGIMVNEACGLG